MSQKLYAVGVLAVGSFLYIYKNFKSQQQPIISKADLKPILILLRKRIFSTLRQIAFIVNNIKATEGDCDPKKINEVIMNDGKCGRVKLDMIERMTLSEFNVSKQLFELSCTEHRSSDLEIKLLLSNFKMDIEMALEGNINTYKGPTPALSSQTVICVYRQILKRRMSNIEKKFNQDDLSQEEGFKKEFQIEDYLEMVGITNEKEANEKTFIAILQKTYRDDADFRVQFEALEFQMEQLVKETKLKKEKKNQKDNPQNEKDSNVDVA